VQRHRQDHHVTPPSDIRRKRLSFRSWHRGTRESDLILGRFADAHLDHFDDGQLDCYEALLECSDADLFDWITGRATPPPEHDHDVTRLLIAHTNASPHPPSPPGLVPPLPQCGRGC
jgi:antitoxin CptB